MKIKCTQCGAEVPIEQETSFLRCPFCETALYMETDRTVRHFYIGPQVGERDLAPMVCRKLAQREIKDEVEVVESRTYYFPFWRFDTKLGASVLVPAALAPLEDLAAIKNPAGDLKLFSEDLKKSHEVVEPEMLLDDAVLEARAALELDESVEFSGSMMVHVPLWEVKYECQGQTHRAVIEAVSGMVYADDWPAAPARKKDLVLGWIALLAFLLFLIESALIPGFLLTLAAYAVTAAGIYFLARSTLHRMGW